MDTLIKILDSHEEVILDTSVHEHKSSFLFNNFHISNFIGLNKESLQNELFAIENFLEALKHHNSRTIPEVTREIRTYAEKLGKKRSYLLNENGIIKRKHTHKQELFKDLEEKAFECYNASREKELKIRDKKYRILTAIISYLENILHLKSDFSYLIDERDRDNSHDSNTDEKIVATLFYKSIFSEKNPILVTKDRDFMNLLKIIPQIIGSDDFMPYNKLFRRQIIGNSFKLYFKNLLNENYSHYLNYSYINFDPEFRIRNLSNEVNQQTKKYILDLWKEFSQDLI